jgi:hypothetical protein
VTRLLVAMIRLKEALACSVSPVPLRAEMSESCLVCLARQRAGVLVCKMLKVHGRDSAIQVAGKSGTLKRSRETRSYCCVESLTRGVSPLFAI